MSGGVEVLEPAAKGRDIAKSAGENVIGRAQSTDEMELLKSDTDLWALPTAQAWDGHWTVPVSGASSRVRQRSSCPRRSAWHGDELVFAHVEAEIGQDHVVTHPLREIVDVE